MSFLSHCIPILLHQHVTTHEQAQQRRIQQWKAGDWFGMHTERVVEIFEPYIVPLELSQLLGKFLGNDLQMIIFSYATCTFSPPHVGVILQDEKMALWDKMLGKPLAWLLELVVKHLNLPLTVETIKSPPDVMITTKPGGAAPIIKREQPKSPTSCWTLVVLHDNGEQYYQNLLLKSFRSRVVIKLPGNIEMKLVEPPYSISQKKKNAIGQATVRVKDVVHIDAPHLEAIAMCFEAVPNSATQGFTQRLRAAYPYITKLAALPPYTPERGVSLSQQLTKPTTASKRQGCSNWPCRAGHCSNEDCPNYCFDSDCMIEMIDDNGEIVGVKSASQIRVGDCVRGIWADGTYSNTTVVVGVVKELVGRSVGMVEVSPGNFLTPGHPLQTSAGGLFVRPKQISPLQHKHVEALYNFVLSERVALTLHTTAAVSTNSSSSSSPLFVACSSLGQFCPGVDAEGSFFGTSRVIQQCLQHPQWPYITKNSTRT